MSSVERYTGSNQEAAISALLKSLAPVENAQEVTWRAANATSSLHVVWIPEGDTYEAYLPETNKLPQSITAALCHVTDGQKTSIAHGVYHENYADGAYWQVDAGNKRISRLRNISRPFDPALSVAPDTPVLPWSRNLSRTLGKETIRKKPRIKLISALSAVVLTGCAVVLSTTSLKDADSQSIVLPTQAVSPAPSPSAEQPTPSPSTAPSAPKENPKTLTLNIATWNALYSNDPEKITANIKVLFETNKNNIIGLQEAKRLTKSVLGKMACSYTDTSCNKLYAMFPGNKGSSSRNQIVWNRNGITFVEGKTELASSDPGHDRYINWAHFKETSTGQDLYVIDAHAPNGAESNGKPSKKEAKVKAYKNYMHDLVSTVVDIQSKGEPVFLLGDLNVSFRADNAKCSTAFFPCRELNPRMNDVWSYANISGANDKLGTQGKGNRVIDRFYFSESNSTETFVTKAYVGTDNGNMTGGDSGSDHKPFNVAFQLKVSDKPQNVPLVLDGVPNFRDSAAISNGVLEKHEVYRSFALNTATQTDITRLSALLKNGAVIDLRTADERAKNPDPAIPGVANYNFPVVAASNAKSYVQNFVVNDADRAQFGAALKKIAETDGSVLIHCAKGKDRTGWLNALLQTIRGVDEATIMKDYLQSKTSGEKVDASWLNAALTESKAKYGSTMGYISQGLGVDQATINKLKEKLTPTS